MPTKNQLVQRVVELERLLNRVHLFIGYDWEGETYEDSFDTLEEAKAAYALMERKGDYCSYVRMNSEGKLEWLPRLGGRVVIQVYGEPVELTVTEVSFSYCAGVDDTGKIWYFDPEAGSETE